MKCGRVKHFGILHFPALICRLNCLQLVCFVDEVEKASFGDVIVVVNHSTSDKDQVEDNPSGGIYLYIKDVCCYVVLN